MSSTSTSTSTSTNHVNPAEEEPVTAEFKKIISDFVADIATVFPEHGEACAAMQSMDSAAVFKHCKRTYAPQFFNILYRNDTVLFAEPIELLPGLNFKALWETPDVSDATKEAVWKYLQLVMFSVVSDLSDTSTFGDAAKLFEAIDESVLKSKLEEVMQQMQDMFKADGEGANTSAKDGEGANTGAKDGEGANTGAKDGEGGSFPLPGMDPNSMHEHLSGLLGGKIGNLAKEIAEETAAELNLNPDDEASAQSVFQNLFKNPGKLMGIVKSVGQKLDAKMKSGEIKESEIMQEASELMNKMKKMPGVNNMADLLKKMGGMSGMGGMGDMGMGMADMAKMAASMGLGGKNGKLNMGAMQSHLNQNMKSAQTRERMQQKLEQRKADAQKAAAAALKSQQPQQQPHPQQPQQPQQPQDQTPIVFSTGEKVERTPRFSAPPAANAEVGEAPSAASNKKKKNKNRK